MKAKIGFTLIEVIVFLGIIVLAIIPAIVGVVQRGPWWLFTGVAVVGLSCIGTAIYDCIILPRKKEKIKPMPGEKQKG